MQGFNKITTSPRPALETKPSEFTQDCLTSLPPLFGFSMFEMEKNHGLFPGIYLGWTGWWEERPGT